MALVLLTVCSYKKVIKAVVIKMLGSSIEQAKGASVLLNLGTVINAFYYLECKSHGSPHGCPLLVWISSFRRIIAPAKTTLEKKNRCGWVSKF